jgi:flavin reductase (DIM6/NTAB) family NADH-FMN oxidoreductase RutF
MREAAPPALPRSATESVVADGLALPDAFRGFMSVYFTGVAVVTSIDTDGHPRGLTCNSLTSVALSPPTLLVCLALGTGTLAAVQAKSGFVVNILHDGGRPTAELFASPERNRFERIAWRRSAQLGLPWLSDDTCAMAECAVTDVKPVGDHAVVFGHVLSVEHGGGSPLLYGRRRYSGGLL